jgi:uncharacterized protein
MKYNYLSSLWFSAFIFLVFILQATINNLTDTFILDSTLVLTRPWTILTTIFLHADISHLFYNLFGLALFGFILESIIGTKRFLRLFFIAGLAASVVSIPFYTRVLGASGAIFGVIGMLAILRPKMMVWVYGMPMPMIAALFIWALIDIFGFFFPSGTASLAHLGGLMVGIIYGLHQGKQFKEIKQKKEKIHIDEEKVREWEKGF